MLCRLTLYHTILNFNVHYDRGCAKPVLEKKKSASDQHFLLFLPLFCPIKGRKLQMNYVLFVVSKCFQFRQKKDFVIM